MSSCQLVETYKNLPGFGERAMTFELRQIGEIITPFEDSPGVPIQSCKSNIVGEINIWPEYKEGLASLEGFSHVILLYWFHKTAKPRLTVIPFLDNRERGVFSTRAPTRPNPIGISTVELIEIEECRLKFRGADMLNNTPLIDIKPFVAEFDNRLDAKSGWLNLSQSDINKTLVADDRFQE